MSLASSMSKVLNFTNKVIGVMNPQSSGVNVSPSSWLRVMGLDDLSFNSVSDFKTSIQEIKGVMSQTLTTASCLKYLAWDNPAEMLNLLDQLTTGVVGAIASVVDEIYDAVSYQISAAINQITGAIASLVGSLQQLVNSIMTLFSVFCDTINSWADWSNLKIELGLREENCKDMFASIMACFLNKYLGSYLDEIQEKVVGGINEVGASLNNKIYEDLQDVNMFSSYARQEAFLLKKASIQLSGFSKESLLG